MSDFELISLYNDQVTLFLTGITIVTTILFSFIVGMYLMAGRLHALLLFALTAVFGAVNFGLVTGMYAAGARAASMGKQLVERIQADGSEIAWMYSGVIPENLPRNFFFFFIAAILMAVLYVIIRRREVYARRTRMQASHSSE